MADQKNSDKPNGEFEYQRFLDVVDGATELRAVNDQFARQVFAYLQTSDCFTAKEFVGFLAELINIAAYPSTADRLMSEDKERFPNHKSDGTEAAERIARRFGEMQSFSLPIQPEENKLENLSLVQKFDLIHFALCALNFLSNENLFCLPSIEYLTTKRQELIKAATRNGEHSGAYLRAEKVKKHDIVNESRWKIGDLSLKEFSIRQKVLASLLLMFGSLEVPTGRNKTRVGDFIYSVTGNDRQKIKDLLVNPIKVEKDADGNPSKRSIELLCGDLRIIQDRLVEFGIKPEVIQAIGNEIDFLIEDLEENQNKFESF
jgi:hypothetical protein